MECSDHVQSNNHNASCSVEIVQGEVRCSSLIVNLLFGRVMKILPTKFNSLTDLPFMSNHKTFTHKFNTLTISKAKETNTGV